MKMFKDFNLKDETYKFIELNKFEKPTLIQEEVIPEVLKKKDIVAISATGTGKTHSFLIPLMEMINPNLEKVQAVITSPTRELAMQIYNNAKLISKANPNIKIKLISGGINKEKMIDSLKVQPHIVIGTPGRIKDLFLSESVLRVDSANIYILDEADMTLEYGFLEDVDAICSRMHDKLQMLAFSATVPLLLKQFLKKYMHNMKLIDLSKNEKVPSKIEHILIPCKHMTYSETILNIKDGFMPYVCLIIANTRDEASKIAKDLRNNDTPVVEIHGGLQQRERKQAMKLLTSLKQTYIVATDIASRGLDIEGITHVISCGFPSELDFYIHRSGRTGRNNREGTCFALYRENDENAIKSLIGRGIKFSHKSFKNGIWKDLKPYGEKRKAKNDKTEIEIAKKLTKKSNIVKPGYKKKRKEEIAKIKRKEKREFIQNQIKTQRKEFFKKQQRLKSRGIEE